MEKNCALGVFFRVPEYGKVKRRLAKEIGNKAALEEYKNMLHTTLKRVSTLRQINLYGFYDGNFLYLKNFHNNIPLILQKGYNLGEKMYNAISYLLKKGYKRVLLIGVDSPDVPLSFIVDACNLLEYYELVIGPSEDGGYYLVGLSKPFKNLFYNDIRWGSSKVFLDTLRIAEKEQINYHILPVWYDIDNLEALTRWKDLR